MTIAWGIKLGRRAYVSINFGMMGEHNFGWRPVVWTTDPSRAQKFASEAQARAFLDTLPFRDHGAIVVIPPMGVPGGNDPGAPATSIAQAA